MKTIWRYFTGAFFLFMLAPLALAEQPEPAAGWQPDFATAGIQGVVNATTIYNGDLIVAGSFSHAGPVEVNGIARWDGQQWHAMGASAQPGLSPYNFFAEATALAVYDGDLYLGGQFSAVDGVETYHIARWDGSAWLPVVETFDDFNWGSYITTLHVHDDRLIVGGRFDRAGGIDTWNIAAFDGSQWHSLGDGLGGFNSTIEALHSFEGHLIAAGAFSDSGDPLAVWNGESWAPLSPEPQYPWLAFSALATWQGELVAVPNFNFTAAGLQGSHPIRWDGEQWQLFNESLPGLNGQVFDLMVFQGELVAAGSFRQSGDNELNFVARWNGNEWLPLPGADGLGLGPITGGANSLLAFDDRTLVGGGFQQAGGQASSSLMAWDSDGWHDLEPAGTTGVNGKIYSFLKTDQGIFVAGEFTRVAGQRVNYVARWDGEQWQALGNADNPGLNGEATSLAWFNDNLIVGGRFTTAGGQAANGIARWDGIAWWPMGSGLQGNHVSVSSMIEFADSLIVAGNFPGAGGVSSPHLIRWDGSSWHSISAFPFRSIGSPVRKLLVLNDELILVGSFDQIGGQDLRDVARWDGANFSGFINASGDTPRLGNLYDAVVVNDRLYVGGTVSGEFNVPGAGIHHWDGLNWQHLNVDFENNTNSYLYTLAEHEGDLIAGGLFTAVDGLIVNRLARYDGQIWHAFGEDEHVGVQYDSTPVLALQASQDELLVGGEFFLTGNVASRNLGRYSFRTVDLEMIDWDPQEPVPGQSVLFGVHLTSEHGLPEDGLVEFRASDGSQCQSGPGQVEGQAIRFDCQMTFQHAGHFEINARFTRSATHSSRRAEVIDLPVLWQSDVSIVSIAPVYAQVAEQPFEVQVQLAGQQPGGVILLSEDSGSSCQVQAPAGTCLLFPSASGSRQFTAMYPGDDRHHPSQVTIDLQIEPSRLGLSPNPLEFGTVPAGQSSAAHLVSLQNLGDGDLNILAAQLNGEFAVVPGGTCPDEPFTLSAGESCTMALRFLPLAEGTRLGALSISSNSPEGLHGLILRGNGQDYLLRDRFEP